MKPSIAIIDSGGANITSVVFAIERLGYQPVFTRDWETISNASRVILPGVGAAGAAMNRLREYELADRIPELQQPVLGICLGLQLLFRRSEEGNTSCLGIIPADVTALPEQEALTLPHTGWNHFDWTDQGLSSFLSSGFPRSTKECVDDAAEETGAMPDHYGYFVHRYAAPMGPWTLASTLHGIRFSSIVAWKNFAGIQFHPERSALAGSKLLSNFLACSSPLAGACM